MTERTAEWVSSSDAKKNRPKKKARVKPSEYFEVFGDYKQATAVAADLSKVYPRVILSCVNIQHFAIATIEEHEDYEEEEAKLEAWVKEKKLKYGK